MAQKESKFSHVEETGLLTMYCKVIESESEDPIIVDLKAVEMAKKLDPMLKKSGKPMAERLAARKLDQRLVVHIALRAKKYDQYARDFLERYPDAVIVNIGCGMDARFFRIDNGRVGFFDLDLPEVITYKKTLLQETDRYRMIGQSALEDGWMETVKQTGAEHFLFMAEGVFMYLKPKAVKRLVLEIKEHFPGSELVCEVVKKSWTEGTLAKLGAMKMKNRCSVGENAGFKFGLDHPGEMESWAEGIRLLGHWSYFQSDHPRLGYLRLFGRLKYFREMQYTVHYMLALA
jgi:methyltransferase (TIGR00027 family)